MTRSHSPRSSSDDEEIITLDLENPCVRMTQASGDTNPLLQPPHIVSLLTMLPLSPWQTTTMVGLETPP